MINEINDGEFKLGDTDVIKMFWAQKSEKVLQSAQSARNFSFGWTASFVFELEQPVLLYKW